MKPIVIVDYGLGNLGSIQNILRKAGAEARLAPAPDDLAGAGRIILPGVGSFDAAIRSLRRLGFVEPLAQLVRKERVPILGICLGMQLFSRGSAEGTEPGLGWLEADTVAFDFAENPLGLKVPHMGWNGVTPCRLPPFFADGEDGPRFYFVHSFHLRCHDPGDVLATTTYGYEFPSAVCRGNILGTQFHPEKSHRFGLHFFRAFAHWQPEPERP